MIHVVEGLIGFEIQLIFMYNQMEGNVFPMAHNNKQPAFCRSRQGGSMKLSDCIFYTGHIPACSFDYDYARDMIDELFTHSDGVSKAFYEELQSVGIQLPRPPFRLVSLSPGADEPQFTMGVAVDFAQEMMEKIPQFITADGLFFYGNARVQGIVSIDGAEQMERLYRELNQIIGLYQDRPHPHAAISNGYEDHCYISRACVENQEAHQFARFLERPIDVIVQPADFYLQGGDQPTGEDEEFFGQISQKICNALMAEDRQRAHRALDEGIHYTIGKFPWVSGVHMRALRFCHALELTLVGADLIDRLFVQNFHLLQDVIEADNERVLRETFHHKLDGILSYADQRKALHHGEQMRQVVEYITRNLTDSTLSIGTIADNFHIHEDKLSAAFRSYFHESIPNMIHQRRVEYIREQLLHTEKTVQDICVDAGYISIATMNRAFYRLEGMYPGQYRKQVRNKSRLEKT